jgi:ribosomal protein L37AE/L43A
VARRVEFVGVWMCQECGKHGVSNHKTSTADQASTRALIDLCVHHNLVHRRPRKPK